MPEIPIYESLESKKPVLHMVVPGVPRGAFAVLEGSCLLVATKGGRKVVATIPLADVAAAWARKSPFYNALFLSYQGGGA
jgi:hypothetical protein